MLRRINNAEKSREDVMSNETVGSSVSFRFHVKTYSQFYSVSNWEGTIINQAWVPTTKAMS